MKVHPPEARKEMMFLGLWIDTTRSSFGAPEVASSAIRKTPESRQP